MLSSIISWRGRQHQRVETEEVLDGVDHPLAVPSSSTSDGDEENEVNSIMDEEEGDFIGGRGTGGGVNRNNSARSSSNTSRGSVSTTGSNSRNNAPSSNTPRGSFSTDGGNSRSSSPRLDADEGPRGEDEDVDDDNDDDGGTPGERTVRFSEPSRRRSTTGRRTLRRADLEEERELVRRRTSACVLLSSFILLRLWIQAVVSGDFGLLLLCLVFTSWTARFIRHTRDREEELDRMINEWDDNQDDAANDARLRRMSFQSQLALAIMQSQLQMMQGGHGHPDGGNDTPGVSEEAKGQWDRFTYQSSSGFLKSKTKPEDAGKDTSESSDDEPHCSICLGEYEDGEKLVMLPCKHIYHEDCISSWCDNHTRCPLCNTDLEDATGENAV